MVPDLKLLKVAQPLGTWLTIISLAGGASSYVFTHVSELKTSIRDEAKLGQRLDDQDKHLISLIGDVAALKAEMDILLDQQRVSDRRRMVPLSTKRPSQ